MLDIEVKSDQDGNSKDREVVLSVFSDILPRWFVRVELMYLKIN